MNMKPCFRKIASGLSRTVGIGVISGEEAVAIGLSGPALRGSGVAWDIRKSRPYAAYADMDFDIPLGENGDTYDRYLVRLEEMRQSRRIIDQALDNLPDGPVNAKLPKIVKPPVGDYYHSIEGPKGEIGCYLVSDGTAQPWRVRVRPPSLDQSAGAEANVHWVIWWRTWLRSSERWILFSERLIR